MGLPAEDGVDESNIPRAPHEDAITPLDLIPALGSDEPFAAH
jgi:hypothetical protein